ncbi:EF-hand domain-containing protein [Rariglobus hedericola]|uniref:EF-hand domain-containing protein n=1 Tax=Rariglobus hedericola TaxID=2597822 RepID=A0A556QQZ9_9BACT|nr:EF-hand domain-containing protein [Rariglobus hedericola]TSJ79067.1 hypothetical protein FPL22_07165 [Rariglobus hedericola]
MKNPTISILRSALFAVVALCAVSVSRAEEPTEKKVPDSVLKKYDANNDGKLDESEKAVMEAAKAKKKAEAEAKRLEKFDTNKDGKLDESEIAAEKKAKKDAKEAAEKKKAEKAAGTQ